MKRIQRVFGLFLVVFLLTSFISCDLSNVSSDGTGSLMINYQGSRGVIWEADDTISSYKIIIWKSSDYTSYADKGSAYITQIYDVSGSDAPEQFIIDGLRAGDYVIEVEGYDDTAAANHKIGYLKDRFPSGTETRNKTFSISRSTVTTLDVEVVPSVDGTGILMVDSLSFIDFTGDSDELIQNNPKIVFAIEHLDDTVNLDSPSARTAYNTLNTAGKRDDISTTNTYDMDHDHKTYLIIPYEDIGDAGPEDLADIRFSNLPAGWYELSITFYTEIDDGDAENVEATNRIKKDVYFVQILNGQTTHSGALSIKASELETGALDFWVYENLEPMSVSIGTMTDDAVDMSDVGSDGDYDVTGEDSTVIIPATATKFKMGTDGAAPSTESVSSSAVYRWYVNGQYAYTSTGAVSTFTADAASGNETPEVDSLLYPGNFLGEAGIYEVAVYVIDVAGQANMAIGVGSVTIDVHAE